MTASPDKMDFSPDDDRALMLRAGEGDSSAFARILEKHQKSLLNFFIRMGAYPDEAEDLLQETFLRLYKYKERYRPTAGFSTFLYTLARNTRYDWLRKSGREPTSRGSELPNDIVASQRGVEAADLGMDAATALAGLSEKLRETVLLTLFQGLSYPEAAAVLGIPPGTVKSRMFNALQKLRERLLGASNDE